MLTAEVFLILLILVPLAVGLLMLCIPAREGTKLVFEILHVLSMAFVAGVSIVLVVNVIGSQNPITVMNGMIRLDSLGAIFVGLIGVTGFLVGLVALSYARFDLKRGALDIKHFRTYYIFYELFVFAMLLTASADNIVLMWVAIEATMLATIFLVSTYNKPESLEAAWKYLVVCSVGVAFALYGVVMVFSNANAVMGGAPDSMLWSAMLPHAAQFDHRLIQIAFVFIVIGFGTKAGLFPMLTWVPDADSQAPAPISALLSGVLMAVAMLLIVRFYGLTALAVGSLFPQIVMLVLGMLTVIVGAFGLYHQKDLMRKFAYSSCENLGVAAVGLGVGGPLGIAVAILHPLFHGFVKCLMFCMCANVNEMYGTTSLDKVKAVLRISPMTGVLMAFGLFALAGFPGFCLFVTELMTIIAGIAQHYLWVIIIFALLLSVVVAGLGKVITYNVLGPNLAKAPKKRISPLMILPEFALLAMVMWFGFYTPQIIATGVETSVAEVTQNADIAALHDTPLFDYVFHDDGHFDPSLEGQE